jgi:hypothetical protein
MHNFNCVRFYTFDATPSCIVSVIGEILKMLFFTLTRWRFNVIRTLPKVKGYEF